LTIIIVLGVLLLGNAILAFYQRVELKENYTTEMVFLTAELVFLVFFLIDLGIRLGTLIYGIHGRVAKKPMDLSFFTAILKALSSHLMILGLLVAILIITIMVL